MAEELKSSPVRVLPGPDDPDPLAFARRLTNGMDTAVRIPGTQLRFGLDALIGLIPGVGDVAGAILSVYLVILAARLRAPRATITRMLINIGLDAVAGVVPVVGDLFDVAYRANSRNFALLEKHVEPEPPPKKPSVFRWVMVIIGILLMLAAIIFLSGWALSRLSASL